MTHEVPYILRDKRLSAAAFLEQSLDLSQTKLRETIAHDNVLDAVKFRLDDIEINLETQLKLLALYATIHSDQHYQYRKKMDEQGDFRARFATTVTLKNKNLKCTWNYNGYQGGREDGAYFKELPKLRGNNYSIRVFKEALPDERLLIDDIEERYKNVREAAVMLKNISRQLKWVQKYIAKMDLNSAV